MISAPAYSIGKKCEKSHIVQTESKNNSVWFMIVLNSHCYIDVVSI